MRFEKVVSFLTLLVAISIITWFGYHKFFYKPLPQLYKTENPTHKNISQYVYASGILEVKNPIKIGSIISGTIKNIHVKENQLVTKGQLLAEIDPGTGETDFHIAYQEYEKLLHTYRFQKNHFARLNSLYKANQLAKDVFEQAQQVFHSAKRDFKIARAKLEKEKLLLSARKVIAVEAGFITAVNITLGSGVIGANVGTSEPLFEIAPEITNMQAKLDIDESDIGVIQTGQLVTFTVNTYPERRMKSVISDVGFSPKQIKNSANSALFYKSAIEIDNKEKLLRPGMALNAKIHIARSKKALAIKGLAFQINPHHLKTIAKKLNYDISPLQKTTKVKLRKKHKNTKLKFVWVAENRSFIEKAILLGITDGNYFEVKSGLTPSDNVILDVVEPNKLQNIYKRQFSVW